MIKKDYLSYIDCIRKEFPERKESVRGIIVADDFDDLLKIAITETPQIKLVKYKIGVDFEEIK